MDKPLKVVKVKADNELGWMLINESDYDPQKHQLVDEAKPKKAKAKKGK